jgi:hypothetical protein
MRWTWMPWLTLALVLGARASSAATPLDALVLTPVSPVTLDLTGAAGEQAVPARAAVRYDATGIGLVPLVLPVPPAGSGSSLRAYHQGSDGSIYFSLSATETLAGTTFQPSDIIRWDGSSYTRHFHGLAEGIPAGVTITGYAQDASGTDLLAFSSSFNTISGTSITPRDVIVWPPGAALPSVWLATGLPVGIGIDGLSVLENGHVLISLSSDAVFAGALRADEDVLEYDPASESWELAVDTSDLDPDWAAAGVTALYAKSGVANVGVPEPVVVRMAIVNADVAPRRYELRLDCGPHRVRDIAFGVALTPDVTPASITIGSCGLTGCVPGVGSTEFGPTVDPATAAVEFSPDPATQRDDAIYVELDGAGGGLLCLPGQDVLLAEVEIAAAAAGFLPAQLPTGEGAAQSHRQGGAELPAHLIRHAAGALDPVLSVNASVSCEEETGLVFDLKLESLVRLYQLGFALVLPDGVRASQVSFEGCTTLEDPDLNQLSCAGATQLGEYVDADSAFTVGPAPALALGGGHPGAMYVTVNGSALTDERPALNFPGRASLLGRIRYSESVPPGRRHPPMVLVSGRGFLDSFIPLWIPIEGDTIQYSGGTGFGSSKGIDIDADGLCDDVDLCIGSANNTDSGGVGVTPPTSPQDGIGDDCQCGDVTNLQLELMPGGVCGADIGVTPPGIVNQNDLTGIRCALTGAQSLPTSLARKCNVRGPTDPTLSQLGLRRDCDLSDSVVLRRRFANPSLAVDPPDLQLCAAP